MCQLALTVALNCERGHKTTPYVPANYVTMPRTRTMGEMLEETPIEALAEVAKFGWFNSRGFRKQLSHGSLCGIVSA